MTTEETPEVPPTPETPKETKNQPTKAELLEALQLADHVVDLLFQGPPGLGRQISQWETTRVRSAKDPSLAVFSALRKRLKEVLG